MAVLSELFDIGWEPNRPQWTGPTIQKDHAYDLAIIEFDDQGWYYDLSARTALASHLKSLEGKRLSIVVFIHGWRHNAAQNDLNLKSFRNLLDDAFDAEAQCNSGRRVLGIYLAWRGLSLRGYSGLATFWTRKSAALRVAIGSIRETLAHLRRHQHEENRHLSEEAVEADEGTRLVLVGHSFGGLILFSAVAEYLIESTVATRVVRPFGDLVILINPAFEATRYEPLASAIRARGGYESGQRTCFMAITAKNDRATGLAFPCGRWLNTSFEAKRRGTSPDLPPDAQQKANLNTVGHLPWLTTHKLVAPPGTNAAAEKNYNGGVPINRKAEATAFADFNAQWRQGGLLRQNWQRTYSSGTTIEHVQGHPSNPFWVVEADAEVVDGHNGIFRPVFLDFLRQFCDDRLRRKL